MRLSSLAVKVRESFLLATDFSGSEQLPLVLLVCGAGAPATVWPDTFRRDLASAGRHVNHYCAEMAMVGFSGRFASATSLSAGSTVLKDLAEAFGLSGARRSTWDVLMQNHPTGDFDRDPPGWLQSWGLLIGSRRYDEEMAIRYTRSLYDGDPRNIRAAVNHI